MPRKSAVKCYLGCNPYKGTAHCFPPNVYPHTEKFDQWKMVLSEIDRERGDNYIYNNIRICDYHFEECYRSASGRLTKNAVPTLNIASTSTNSETYLPKKTSHSADTTVARESPLHVFPDPAKYPERFREWVRIVGRELETPNDHEEFRKMRVCDQHFIQKDRNRNNRLNSLAVPSLYLPNRSINVTSTGDVVMMENDYTGSEDKTSAKLPEISPFVPDSQTSTTHEATLLHCNANTVQKEPSNLVYNKPKMVKRKIGNDIVELSKKLPKLEGKMKRAAKISVDSSDDNCNMARPGIVIVVRPVAPGETAESRAPPTPTKTPEHGKEIHVALANCLQQIIVNGLNNNRRKALEKKYLTPENCPRMIPPLLNPELKAVLPEASVKRDRGIENRQKKLGTALSCLSDVINTKMQENDKDLGLLKQLMDVGKLMCDSLHSDSVKRRSLALSSLKKDSRKDPLMQTKIDKYLFVEASVLTLKTKEV